MPRSKSKIRFSAKKLMEMSGRTNLFQKNIETAGTGIKPFVRIKNAKYAQRILLGDNTANPFPQVFRINSVFDPDETGTGHQTRGHDELAAIYNDYMVISAGYKITLVNLSTTTMFVWAHLDTDATSDIVSWQDAQERGSDVKRVLLMASNDGYQEPRVLFQGKVDLTRYAFPTSTVAAQFKAGVGANPGTPVRLHIQVSSEAAGAIPTSGLAIHVELTQDVIYSSPIATFSS